MSHINPEWLAYQKLAQAAATFSSEESSTALKEFMDFVRLNVVGEAHTDAEMMEFLSTANLQPDLASVEILAQYWIPYDFDVRTAEIRWCLPQGRAVQPFYDEYITHCRQQMVNVFVVPRSSIASLLRYAEQRPELPEPSGFIFHLSRCGSTLVSGCLAQLESCSVLSESPLLTEILLAKNIDAADKKLLLRLCLYLQARASPHQPHVIVKWNAWDIFHWEMIRAIWPHVPVLMLVRSPVEILASHARSVGRHMSGDPSLGSVQNIFGRTAEFKKVLDYRLAVLESLMTKMLQVHEAGEVSVLDYAALDEAALMGICAQFGIELSQSQRATLRQKLTRYSKSPDVEFQPDAEKKWRRLSEPEIAQISHALSALYRQLISNSNK